MCRCGVTLKRWFCIFCIISVILIIAGLVFIIYGAVNYESTSQERRYPSKDRVGAVIDAGGSATRLTVFSYNEKTKRFRQLGKRVECEENGLDYYTKDTYLELRNKIKACLLHPFDAGFISGYKKVPLYMGASGGMRLLQKRDETLFNSTLVEMKSILESSNFDIKFADVITGDNEALWNWVAVNTMKTADKRVGVIDFGSSSIQMVFEPAPKTQGPSHLTKVNVVEGETTLYSNSYLCFGTTEMERRVTAKLVQASGYNMVTYHPCFFTGFEKNFTAKELFQSPCVAGEYSKNTLGESIEPPTNATTDIYTLRGTSDQSACSKAINDVINTQCNTGTCGMNGIYQSPVNGNFLGTSTLFYTARFFDILDGGDLPQYKQKRDEICAKSWNQTIKQDKYASRRCFDASYTYFVLTKGLKFPEDSKQVRFAKQNDNGADVQWSLGLIYTKKDEMYKRGGYPVVFTIISRSSNYIGLIIVGVIFLIIGSILLVCSLKARRSNRDLVKTADDDEM